MDIAILDFEAFNWNQLYAVGVYNGKEYKSYFHGTHKTNEITDTDEVVKQAFELLKEIGVKKSYIYAHNGGKYDFLPIIKYCAFNDYDFTIDRLINGRITAFTVYEDDKPLFKFRDSFTLLSASFKKLAESFNVNHKKLKPNENEDYSHYVTPEYLENDVIGLHEILSEFMVLYRQYGGSKKRIPLTISSASYSLYWNKYNINNVHDISPSLSADELNIRKAYYGGRTEVFKRYYSKEYAKEQGYKYPLYYYDVNSLYPSQMIDKLYPTGAYQKVKHFNPNKLGIYYLWFETPRNIKIPLLPYRDKESGRLIFPKGRGIKGWYCTPEIVKAKELGYKINIVHGYEWENSSFIFNKFISDWYEIKKNSTGGKRTVAKMMLNSLYGRFGMRRERTEVMNSGQTEEYTKKYGWKNVKIISHTPFITYREKKAHKSLKIMPHISAFVSSYARVCLYEFMAKAKFKIWYCDTDSIITDQKINTSDKIGDMKIEHVIDEGYFLIPKLYAIKDVDGGWNKKAKGIDSSLINMDAYKQATFENDFSLFTQTKQRILGFKESLCRHRPIFDTEYRTKMMQGTTTKRLLDGLDTQALVLDYPEY